MQNYKSYTWTIPVTCAHKYLSRTIENIVEQFKIPTVARILDAGCGGGFISNKLYLNGYKNIWGFDLSQSGIKTLHDNYPSLKERFTVHDGYNSFLPKPFPMGEYDVVLSVEVIEHLFSPRIYMNNLNNWLKDKGYLIITTPYHGYFKNLLISLMGKFDKHVNSLEECGHIKFFSKSTLYELFKQSGFVPLKFYGSGRVPFLWKSMVVIAKKL